MRSKIKYLFYFSCFLLFLELAFSIKGILDNSTNLLEIKNKIVQKKNNDLSSIYFIGDSFAETVYLTYSYPIIFDSIAKTRSYNFYDYTKSSSEFDYHEMVIDSLISSEEDVKILYFYTISDIEGLDKKKVDKKKSEKKATFNQRIKSTIRHSETFMFFRDISHYLSIYIIGKPMWGSSLVNYAKDSYISKGNVLIEKLKKWDDKNKKIVLLINYPFNHSIKTMKKWYVYSFFEKMKSKNFKNIEIYQSIDFLSEKDSKRSMSWRNGHPSQQTVFRVSDSLESKISIFKK